MTTPPQIEDSLSPSIIPFTPTSNDPFEQFEEMFMQETENPHNPEVINEDDETTETVKISREVPQRDSGYYDEKRHTFTIDDIPSSKWRDRLVHISSWLQSDCQFYDVATVIKRFIFRLEGRLKE